MIGHVILMATVNVTGRSRTNKRFEHERVDSARLPSQTHVRIASTLHNSRTQYVRFGTQQAPHLPVIAHFVVAFMPDYRQPFRHH